VVAVALGGVLMANFLPVSSDAASLAFEAQFATPADFYNRFDYGYSGLNPYDWNGDAIESFHGDHNLACQAPTTDRTVHFTGNQTTLGFAELFWPCAPNGPDSGHLMTGVDTIAYNIAWFSPRPMFTAVSKVCWDINLTALSKRKWTQVMFVSAADAVRYPAGTSGSQGRGGPQARGTGGFDLGYTSPDFRQNDPNTGIFPQGGTLAGFKSVHGNAAWFQNQDTWTAGPTVPGEGLSLISNVTDKAARYKHCLENMPNNVVRFTQDTPTGPRSLNMPGQIPQHPVRVVFQDDNYDPPKDDFYDPNFVTWHWDNVQVFTADSAPPSTSQAPTTTVPATTTTQATTTQATTTTVATTTTAATTTTQPPTTTTQAPTNTQPPTTTVAPTTTVSSTTTTVDPHVAQIAALQARIAELEQIIADIAALAASA